MPELPEVEVVGRALRRAWVGRTIERVWVGPPSYFFSTPPGTLRKRLVGARVTDLSRHGKYLFATLSDESRLLLHLGMTGQLTMSAVPKDNHVHLVVHFDDGGVATFRDVRKFGKIEWLAPNTTSRREQVLGPDALGIDLPTFRGGLAKRRAPLKSLLLDQSVLAGVGNIYADEALFRAKLSPLRPGSDLRPAEAARLLECVRGILEESIASGGSTINDYLKADGELGGFQDFHRVYGKTGEPCPKCRTPIARVVLGGRSTHFCPKCQK